MAATQYGLNYIESAKLPGLSKTDGLIHQGQNSGYQALNLATIWGASKVLLIGYDMKLQGRVTHFHGDHAGLRNPDSGLLANFAKAFDTIATDVDIVNCTEGSAVKAFRFGSLEGEL